MSPDLRDYFAIQFAAALAREERYAIEFIAGRAYDLADAMIEERERRALAELDDLAAEDRRESVSAPLLDDVGPPSERDDIVPAWLETPDAPYWERDDGPLFAAAHRAANAPSEERPGLARANPAALDDRRDRGTGS